MWGAIDGGVRAGIEGALRLIKFLDISKNFRSIKAPKTAVSIDTDFHCDL